MVAHDQLKTFPSFDGPFSLFLGGSRKVEQSCVVLALCAVRVGNFANPLIIPPSHANSCGSRVLGIAGGLRPGLGCSILAAAQHRGKQAISDDTRSRDSKDDKFVPGKVVHEVTSAAAFCSRSSILATCYFLLWAPSSKTKCLWKNGRTSL